MKIQIPKLLELFLIQLLKNSKKNVFSKTETVIESFAVDIIFSVTQGKLLILMHFALATGLHSITGSHKVIDILNKLGHCINYSTICKIETSQAVKAQEQSWWTSHQPYHHCLQQITTRLTRFLGRQFWPYSQKSSGGGVVNTTHLMAFQEPNSNAEVNITKISVTRTGKCTFEYDAEHMQLSKKVNPKIDQRQIDTTKEQIFTQDTKLRKMYSVWWIWLWKHYGLSEYNSKNNQIVASFARN